MASDYGFAVTQKGASLLAKTAAGETITFTNAQAGDGEMPSTKVPRSMTALVNPLAAGTSTAPSVSGGTVSITLEFRSDLNGGVSEGFWIREVGLYADDPDEGEILFAYAALGDYAEYMGAASDTAVYVRRFPLAIVIGEEVEVSVDWSLLAWMTAEDVEVYCTEVMLPAFLTGAQALIDTHDADTEAHPDIRAKLAELEAMIELLKLTTDTGGSSSTGFRITFQTLDDADVEGVWNEAAARVEF